MTLSQLYWHPTDVHGTTLRLPSHRAVQWLVNPRHEEGRWRTLRHHVRPDAVVYDIGAEQGDLSALLASWAPDGGVVLVEPNEAAWPCIHATFHENGLERRLLAAYVGLVAAESHAEGWRCGLAEGHWPAQMVGTIDPAAGFTNLAEQAADFPFVALDDLVGSVDPGLRPDVLNIDVEGAELEVLRGAHYVLTHDRPVVAVSVHPEFLAHWWQATAADVLSLLASYDYRADLVWADHELHYVAVPR